MLVLEIKDVKLVRLVYPLYATNHVDVLFSVMAVSWVLFRILLLPALWVLSILSCLAIKLDSLQVAFMDASLS